MQANEPILEHAAHNLCSASFLSIKSSILTPFNHPGSVDHRMPADPAAARRSLAARNVCSAGLLRRISADTLRDNIGSGHIFDGRSSAARNNSLCTSWLYTPCSCFRCVLRSGFRYLENIDTVPANSESIGSYRLYWLSAFRADNMPARAVCPASDNISHFLHPFGKSFFSSCIQAYPDLCPLSAPEATVNRS